MVPAPTTAADCTTEESSPAINAAIEALAAHGIGPDWSSTRSAWHRGEEENQDPVMQALEDLDVRMARFQ